ncbi:MAG: HNH endonuclease signature motif containing protein [Candidatus Sericytochromatia bacterium]|nr:HNH endonuclease signature motif containing protein [Candidatus Sericytochromatia bacterium]
MGVSGQALRVWVRWVADAGMAEEVFEVAASDGKVLDAVWGPAGEGVHLAQPVKGDWPGGARAGLHVSTGERLSDLLVALRRAAEEAHGRSLTLLQREVDVTEAEALVRQRRGQDLFRERLIQVWGGRCAVTGLAVPELLRASHAKPWKDATDAERLDPFNGLLLAAHLDAAFDQGLMAVAEDGALLWSPALGDGERACLGIADGLRVEGLTPQHQRYLAYHRERCFRGV